MAAENSTQRLEKRGKLLISLLRRGKREHQRNIIVWGGLRLLSVIAVGALVLLVVSLMAPILPRPIGVLLAALAWVGIAWLVWTCWLRPLRAVPNLAIFSRLVEERRDFRDMLRAALEFSERGTPSGGSVDLAATTVDRAYDEARKLDLTSLFQFPRKRRDAAILLGTASACVLLAFLVPAAPQRLVKGLAFAYPSPASIVYGDLEVANGNLDVLAGDDVVVRVLDHGPLAPEMLLRFNDTGDLWKMRRLEPRGAAAPWVYEFRFESIRDHTSYRFESGKRHTEDFRITVVQRPIVNRFSLKLVPPEYTRREPMLLEEGRGDAIALFGTRIEIEGTGSNALVDGYVVPEEDEAAKRTLEHPQQLQVDGSRFSTAFTLRSDLRYHFEVMDQLGHTNADPVTYQISVIEDSPPYVELREPQGDATIPKSLEVPLVIYASDDFGVSRMTVVYKHERDGEDLGNPERRANMQLHGKTAVDPAGKPLGREPAPELIKTFRWHLKEIGLYPGDYVSFYIEVEDNDDFSGHKTARTPTYRLRLPTLGELYAELQDRDENRMSELEEVLEKGEEVREKFEKLARELKKHPEMDWKKEEEVQRALDKQRELAEKVSEIAEDLQREVEKMEEQQLVSSEIAEKMEEIRKLMEQVEDDALREYMERLQEAMKQISPEEMQRAMETRRARRARGRAPGEAGGSHRSHARAPRGDGAGAGGSRRSGARGGESRRGAGGAERGIARGVGAPRQRAGAAVGGDGAAAKGAGGADAADAGGGAAGARRRQREHAAATAVGADGRGCGTAATDATTGCPTEPTGGGASSARAVRTVDERPDGDVSEHGRRGRPGAAGCRTTVARRLLPSGALDAQSGPGGRLRAHGRPGALAAGSALRHR
jgi:hypothetical protein